MESVPTLFYNEFKSLLQSQKGKIVAITGCTSGTGFVLAKLSLEKGASVVMLNRASERLDKAVESLKSFVSTKDGAFLKSVVCDLGDFKSVYNAAKEIQGQFGATGIDILCNNAGIMAFPDRATGDGYDVQMQTNHLSHFLLTKELLPLLEKCAERAGDARIVNHSSTGRFGSPLEARYLEKLGGKLEGSTPFERYHQTKLANIVFTYALADKLAARNSKVKVTVAHPGFSGTALANNSERFDIASLDEGTKTKFAGQMQSAEDGTLGIAMCSFLEGVNSGDFYGPGARGTKGNAVLIDSEAHLYDDAERVLLWGKSETAIGCSFVV